MAKDPRFNFYPDNYLGGTMGFTLEQHGAYVQLILLNFYIGPFTEFQAIDHLTQLARGNTAVSTELWKFLVPKFKTNGTQFWSERLMKEVDKSKRHSEKQADRVKKRWEKEKQRSGINSGITAVIPVNGTGIGNGIGTEKKGESEGEEPSPVLRVVPRGTDETFPGELVWRDEIYREHLHRLARDHAVPDLKNLLDRWEGWYVNKFDWRKKDLQEMRISFESWIKDPKSRITNQAHGNNRTKRDSEDRPPAKTFGTL